MKSRFACLALAAFLPICSAAPVITSFVSGGSFSSSLIAPGAFATIFGTGLSDAQYTANSLPWPQTLGPTSVKVCDAKGNNCLPCQIVYASPLQVNVLLPQIPVPQVPGFAVAIQETLSVTVGSTTSAAATFTLRDEAPDIFLVGYDCLIDPRYGGRSLTCGLFPTYDPMFTPAIRGALTDQSGHVVYSGNPAKLGQYYTLWLTGLGFDSKAKQPNPALIFRLTNVPVYMLNSTGDDPLTTFIGPSPQYPGLWQINFQLPLSIAMGGRFKEGSFPCGNYNWEVSIDMQQGASYAPSVQIPITVLVGDVPCSP